MLIVEKPISMQDLEDLARKGFGDMLKAVVDVERGIMALGAELHSDEEAALLESGSRQGNLWGINLYPEDIDVPDFIEFDSMINIRPARGNRTRGVDDAGTRERIVGIVRGLVKR